MALITESLLRAMPKKDLASPFSIKKEDKITPAAMDFLKQNKIEIKWSHLDLNEEKVAAEKWVPVGVSNRHIHLSLEDLYLLFGDGYSLSLFKNLSQPGQFAAKETVTILGPKGFIQNVRILGPCRGNTQVEISKTDSFQLGIDAPLRLSGETEDTPGITLIGPNGYSVLSNGVIIAKNHVHMSPEEAKHLDIQEGESLMLKSIGERPVIFADVKVRIHPNYRLDFHIDIDEANAAHIRTGDSVQIVKI